MAQDDFYEGEIIDPPAGSGKPALVRRKGKWYPVDQDPGAGGADSASMGDAEKTRVKDAWKRAESKLAVAQDAERFMDLNRKTGTGGLLAIPYLAETVAPFNSNVSGMMALSNRMGPNFRQAGDPSTKEIQMYKRSAPNVDFPGNANARIQKDLQSDSDQASARAAFLDKWGQIKGTLAGGEEAFLRFWSQRQAGDPQANRTGAFAPPGQKLPPLPPKPASGFKYLGTE